MSEHPEKLYSPRGQIVRLIAMIVATYVYFLLFAEFAFIEVIRSANGNDGALRMVMGMLGGGGITGSLLAGFCFQKGRWALRLAAAFTVCALAAGLAPWLASGRSAPILATLIGVSLGYLTVTLASGLRAAGGLKSLGLISGAGTGLAYAICNVPWVFAASPAAQCWLAGGVTFAGAGVALGFKAYSIPNTCQAGPLNRKETIQWTMVFMPLVWMDSAAFYIIQHTGVLKAENWSGTWTLWGNAATHLAAAVVAGVALDRGWIRGVCVIAALSLALACAGLGAGDTRVDVLYTAGVSLYSVALIYAPARTGSALLTALIFAAGGWVASALGIGMAQDLHGVPIWFPVIALAVLGAALLCHRRGSAIAVTSALVLAGITENSRADSKEVELGRNVYISEGCINCHSQYIRSGTPDVLVWGPATKLDDILKEAPPLLGNRRQGPDLANVGNRRSPDWNRLHLAEPHTISPGSRMPSYRRLFGAGDLRGPALVAYLESLGSGTETLRAKTVAAWRPNPVAEINRERGSGLYTHLCQQCHGEAGHGDGAVASRLSVRPPDWPISGWRRIQSISGTDGETEELARIIKFGLPGTPMAGHETFDDSAVVSLARKVGLLRAGKK